MKMLSPSEILSRLIILVLFHSQVYLTVPVSPSPCTDFYEYACSSTKEHLRSNGMWSIWGEAKDYNEQLLLSSLSSGRARHSSASRAVSFLVDLYRKWERESSKHPAKKHLAGDFDLQSGDFRYILARVYVDAAMEATSRQHIENLRESSLQIAERVKEAMGRLLGRKEAFRKPPLQTMKAHVGYENWYMNDTQLDAWYGLTEANAFQFNHSDSYRENYQAWKTRKRISTWTENDSLTDAFWEITPQETFPWAYPWQQSIFLPLGYLFPAVFQHTSSPAFAYGTIGASAAHELVHNLLLTMRPSFKDTRQCLIEQYSAIVEPETGLSLRGKQTISEDIADNGAIKAAFDAYRGDLKRQVTPETDGQFFVSYAREMCSAFTAEQTEMAIKTGSHTPDKYRVNVVLSNFEPFSQTFSCPLGAPMNPAKKCTVW